MKRGEKYWATKDAKKEKGHDHPIVILECDQSYSVIACIISTKNVGNNILLNRVHFDNSYRIKYRPSYLIKRRFNKLTIDLEGKLGGKLTVEGLDFIERELEGIPAETLSRRIWEKEILEK